MNPSAKVWAAVVLGAAVATAGCDHSEYYANSAARQRDKKTAEARLAGERSVAKASYYEVEHDGRIYVVGSAEAAEKIKAGQHPSATVTKIGYGPKGETVVFEGGKDHDVLEGKLIAEYDARHAKGK